jgi:hypothetical protein
MLLHAKNNTPTAAVSSIVAIKEPSTRAEVPCKNRRLTILDVLYVAANAHLANKFADKEVIQLAENKKCKGKNVVPHGSNFVKNYHYDVCHDTKIQNGGAIGCWSEGEGNQ